MLTDIKVSKVQLTKIIQLGGFIGKTLGNTTSNSGKNAAWFY